tara:strand:- start:198 stop:911 length:714 start_codon:yes stop_codon:yes gene_type:complete
MSLRSRQLPPTAVDNSLDSGRISFSRLFRAYLAQTTQYRLLKAMEAYFGGRAVHSSQLTGLASGALREPSPKLFLALGVFNVAHGRSLGYPATRIDDCPQLGLEPHLPEAVRAIWEPLQPLCDADGVVMGPSGLLEAFSGLLKVNAIAASSIAEADAPAAASHLGSHLRLQLATQGIDWYASLASLEVQHPGIEPLLMGHPLTAAQIVALLPALSELLSCTEEELLAIAGRSAAEPV